MNDYVETVDTTTENRIAKIEPQEWSIERVTEQVIKINTLLRSVMKKDQHYGVIPGTGDKPTLLKAGAEKLGVMFRLAPRYKIEKTDLPNEHREYEVICALYHINTGDFWGEGLGVCSTMESKYRYRSKQRVCPECEKEAIIKGKEEYGGGWLCYKKKGGCGAKFNDGNPQIEKQSVGKIENPDIADTYNMVIKMAKKRALVDATITATGASDIFTQDVADFEDEPHFEPDNQYGTPYTQPEPPPPTTTKPTASPKTEKAPAANSYADSARHKFVNYAKQVIKDQTTIQLSPDCEKLLLIENKTAAHKMKLLNWFVYYTCAGRRERYSEVLLEWSKSKRGSKYPGFGFKELESAPDAEIEYAYENGKAAFKQWIDELNGVVDEIPPVEGEIVAEGQ